MNVFTNQRLIELDRAADRRARWAMWGRWTLFVVFLTVCFMWGPW